MWLQWLITSFNLKLMNFRREVKIYDPSRMIQAYPPVENFFFFISLNIIIKFLENNDEISQRSIRKPSMTTVDNKWSPMWLFFLTLYVLTKKVTFDLHVLYSVWHLPIPRLHTKSVPSIVTLKIVLLVKLYFYMPHLSSSLLMDDIL